MNELDAILDDCVRRVTVEGYSVEKCLSLYPEQRAELRPLLEAAVRIRGAAAIAPSPAYKARARTELMRRVQASAQKSPRLLWPAWRLSAAVAVAAIFMLATTTAFAQASLPGDLLYGWKLGSEDVWRAVAPDPVGVDLRIVDRRTMELTRLSSDPSRQDTVLDEFHQVLERLEAEKDAANGAQIDQALQAHQKKLSDAGIKDKQLDEMVHGKGHQPQGK